VSDAEIFLDPFLQTLQICLTCEKTLEPTPEVPKGERCGGWG